MVAAARLYYEDALSQQEIADRLGVSRSSVSRLLRAARERGVVHIEIRAPTPAAALSRSLEAALGLRRAVVVPVPPRGSGVEPLVAPALAEVERLELSRGDVLAVSWGEAMWHIAQARTFPALEGVRVVPAIGGIDEVDVRFQTNEIARRVADRSGAAVILLHAPAVPSTALRRSLLSDSEVAPRFALWDRLDAALVGIGRPPLELGTGPAHVMAARSALANAVGDVAGRHYDGGGDPVELPFESRILGVSREQLRRAGTVIAVAAGAGKARSIVGAARAALVDVIVTDSTTAAEALALAQDEQ